MVPSAYSCKNNNRAGLMACTVEIDLFGYAMASVLHRLCMLFMLKTNGLALICESRFAMMAGLRKPISLIKSMATVKGEFCAKTY